MAFRVVCVSGLDGAQMREVAVRLLGAGHDHVAGALDALDAVLDDMISRCRELDAALIRERTGLVPDPYFSATKLEWLLREHVGVGDRRRDGLAFGTVDSWLAWRLTGQHVTDTTNASRTLLLDLSTLDWDDELLALFGVDRVLLPRIVFTPNRRYEFLKSAPALAAPRRFC